MKDHNDHKTVEMIPLVRGRGRPPTGEALTAAERQRQRRARLKDAGLLPLTVNLPADLHEKLSKFLEFKDQTKDEVIERFLRNALRKR